MWSSASEDIRALRRIARDGPLSVADNDRDLLAASLAVAKVQNDTSGNVRMVKDGHNNTARDDAGCGPPAGGWGIRPRQRPARPRVGLRRLSRHHRGQLSVSSRRWERVRRLVLVRDGWQCVRCGKRGAMEVDHVMPLAKGGAAYALDNLQTLCRDHHAAKTDGEHPNGPGPESLAWRGKLRAFARNAKV